MRKVMGAWLLLALMGLAATAGARDFKVKPGELPELREGEGIVVVAVDTDLAVSSLVVKSDSSAFTGGRLTDIGVGRTEALYVLPAGKYRWDRINLWYWQWSLRDGPEFHFEVKAGKITYAGDLIFRLASRFHVANRGLRTLDWLEEAHPRLLERYGMEYVGHYPDPFLDFYREQLAEAGPLPADRRDRQRDPPAAGALPIAVSELWKPARLQSLSLSPDGRYVVAAVREEKRRWAIDLYDIAAGTIRRLAESRTAVDDLNWKGNDTVLAEISADSGLGLLWIFKLKPDGSQELLRAGRPGLLVDPLQNDPGHILFASLSSRGEPHVHRIDIRTVDALANYRYPISERLNKGLQRDFAWITDASGQIRAALVVRDGKRVLVYGSGEDFRDLLVIEDETDFIPEAISADGSLIYGLSEQGREQRELVAFDTAAKKISRTVFAKPGVDIVSGIGDDQGNVVGAMYYEAGRLVSEYFDESRQALAQSLARSFPGMTVAQIARSDDGQRVLLAVDGTDRPAQIFYLDRKAGRAELLDDVAPWLAERTFAPTRTLRVASRDGMQIEAFLTLPDLPGKRPLVVFPHGGPIGVADTRHFDPELQFMASLGYAVLQVNFRGSEGYGTAFREAGRHNLGTLIEDDIDAAIQAAQADPKVDGSRMCMVGASYGGYSGLVSAVRWPDRFRCVVSMSGVSDRTLVFTASDSARTEEGRAELEKIIGDPRTEAERMRETSPLFQYARLKTPLMLVHGGEDWRVDYEHTRRLIRMLNLADRPPVALYFKNEGHGLAGPGNQVKAWEGIAGFLRQYLGNDLPPPAKASAAPEDDDGDEDDDETAQAADAA